MHHSGRAGTTPWKAKSLLALPVEQGDMQLGVWGAGVGVLGEAGFSVSLLRWVGWSLGEERVEVLWELVWSIFFHFQNYYFL